MKKAYVILVVLCVISIIFGQTFTDIQAGLPGVSVGSSGWCDFDNDGDLDLVLSGSTTQGLVTKIFRNDSGIFADVNAGLLGLAQGSLDLGDYNNDSYVDILICGYAGTESITKLYRNEGNCVFFEVNTTLPNITGSVSWGDYDNDGDLDVLANGTSYLGGDLISTIYRNDDGTFQNSNADLTGLFDKSISWVDYDKDSDLDVVISGSSFGVYSTVICRNEKGIFTEVNTDILGVKEGSKDWGDYDNDGDLDLLITGYNDDTSIYRHTEVYRNDNGVFVDTDSTGFSMLTGVSLGSAKWGDYDNDGDLDILLTGLFYSEGNTGNILREGSVYNNDSGIFSSGPSLSLTRIQNSSTAWGDYDNDGDLDIFMSGWTGSTNISKIFRNDKVKVNIEPNPPTNLTVFYNDSTITFSWDKSTDNETPQDGLSYNFYLGTESLLGDLNASMSDNATGYRKVVDLGNAQQNTSYTLNKALPNGKYYWSV
ncbi:MAG: VCBS repeat-containing protein [Candidatus Delongbacteria bacterium]|jgi:hypothetical protein|nr:VCBS repeat-containing protein [Candidatus Delongbacteria bacterium]